MIEEPEIDILEKLKITRSKNEKVMRIVEKIKKVGLKVLWGDKWKIKENLVLKKEKVYMLKDDESKVEIIQLCYDVLVAGYRRR